MSRPVFPPELEQTPFSQGYRLLGEFEQQKAVWLAWPCDIKLWEDNLNGAQRAVFELAKALKTSSAGVHLLVSNDSLVEQIQKDFPTPSPQTLYDNIHTMAYGDIWLRDTAPLFLKNLRHQTAAICFGFNGWGEKYLFPDDLNVGKNIASQSKLPCFSTQLVLEGGAIEVDGRGTAITTESCLLNPNRNGKLGQHALSQELYKNLGIERIIWLRMGLKNDHTDGHVDNIARFIAPRQVLCMEPLLRTDPNREVLLATIKQLKKSKDRRGQRLEVLTVPSPGAVLGPNNEIMPASYLNFLISNEVLALPLFRCPTDEQAFYRFQHLFPEKKIVGIDCWDLLTGGGSLHCISQTQCA